MLLQKITPRKTITLSAEQKLYAHGAMSATVEMKCEADESIYHITFSETDLTDLLTLLLLRQNEIKEKLR